MPSRPPAPPPRPPADAAREDAPKAPARGLSRPLILASTSETRRALLERLDLPFTAIPPKLDEGNPEGLAPEPLARALAVAKARAVAARPDSPPGALVIGSDQVAELDGERLGKPGTVAGAEAQLGRLAGREHRLVTAVAVVDTSSGEVLVDVDVHRMTMRALTPAQIRAYVAHDRPLWAAGAYLLERRGVALFQRIQADPITADDTAILGLPLMKLLALLRRLGVDLP